MTLSRRNFLRWGALTTAITATGCRVVGRQMARDQLPTELIVPTPQASVSGQQTANATINISPDPIRCLLNRAGYGPRPGDIDVVSNLGFAEYLEQQLHPEEIDDTAADLTVANLALYHMDLSQLVEQEPRDAAIELGWSTVARRIFSQRQLYEAMVEFWSDHFHIYLRKNPRMPLLKIVDDRDVIRPHALGSFRDLLLASLHSPAMLIYLDNTRNSREEPNENYGRELLELHTVGIDAGYTQEDVQAVARILTGLGVGLRGANKGKLLFRQRQHDQGTKTVMGQVFPANGGEDEIVALADFLASHPSTAHFIATKMVRRFVADDPPAVLVDQVAQTFLETDGDIKSLLRVIFLSDQFATAPPKLKRPLTYFISAVRALHGDTRYSGPLLQHLRLLGQIPFMWPAPNGYPDVAAAWVNNLLPRWNFALDYTAGDIRGVSFPDEDILTAGGVTTTVEALDLFADLLLPHSLDPAARTELLAYIGDGDPFQHDVVTKTREVIALLLASPSFQWI